MDVKNSRLSGTNHIDGLQNRETRQRVRLTKGNGTRSFIEKTVRLPRNFTIDGNSCPIIDLSLIHEKHVSRPITALYREIWGSNHDNGCRHVSISRQLQHPAAAGKRRATNEVKATPKIHLGQRQQPRKG